MVQRRDFEGGAHHGGAYKSGFWFKLLHPKTKRVKEYCREDDRLVPSVSIQIRETMA